MESQKDGDVFVGVGVETAPKASPERGHDDSCVFTAQTHIRQSPVEITLGQKRDLGFSPDGEVAVHVELGDASGCSHAALLDHRG